LTAGLLSLLAFVGAAALLLGARPAPAPAEPPAMTKQRSLDAYAKLPLNFIPNEGQTDARVRFYAHGAGHSFYFTPRAAVLAFTKRADGKERGVALHLRFAGADPAPTIEGVQTGTGTVNYFVGRDPTKWQSGLPTYRAVVYHNLWPGIDMRFRGEGGKLKYEFRLRKGASPGDISLAYAGAESLSVSAAGTLLISTPLGVLTDARPSAYQRIEGRKVPIGSRYVLKGSSYGFALGAYDYRYSLVIDPGLAYSTFLGGSGADVGRGIALDDNGNAYVTGNTPSFDFPTTAKAFDVTFNGVSDAFVTKLNDEGSALVYSTYLGSSGFDLGQDIAVDEVGNAYVAGFTNGSDFPTTSGAFQEADPGPGASPEGDDGFVVKLDGSGKRLIYSTYLGGAGEDTANGIGVDEDGNAYVGSGGGTSAFPTTPGAFQPIDPAPGDLQDAMLSKLNPRGSALVFATYLGGSGVDFLNSMTVDEEGHIYAAGSTGSSDFPTTPGAFQPSEPGPGPGPPIEFPRDDGWVAKLNLSGSALVFATYIGGSGDEEGVIGIGVDGERHAYVAGRTDSTLDFPTTPGAYDTTYNGGFNDVFVTKFNPSGSALVYSSFLGGSGLEEASNSVAVDRDGRASVTGPTDSSDFPTTTGAFQSANAGGFDAFVTTLNASGDTLINSTYLGGSGRDVPLGIGADRHGNVYVTGRTGSANFPISGGAFDPTFNGGGRDVFVTKLAIE
jgi:hypothetical protein